MPARLLLVTSNNSSPLSSRNPTSRRRDVESNIRTPCQAVEFDVLHHDLTHPIDGNQGHSPDSIRTCSNSKKLPLPNHLVAAVDDGEGIYLRNWWRRQGVIDVMLLAILDDSTERIATKRIDGVAVLGDVVREESLSSDIGLSDIEMLQEDCGSVGDGLGVGVRKARPGLSKGCPQANTGRGGEESHARSAGI